MCQLKYINRIPIKKNNLFLDRDGVINRSILREEKISSPRSLSEFSFNLGVEVFSSTYIRNNYNLIIITNQPDIERKIINLNFIEKVNNKISKLIDYNIMYICPCTVESNCKCRKPKTGMIDSYFEEFGRGENDFYIGDQESDLIVAKKTSLKFILKIHEYNKNIFDHSDYKITNLTEILEII